jgi:hypothetical protein
MLFVETGEQLHLEEEEDPAKKRRRQERAEEGDRFSSFLFTAHEPRPSEVLYLQTSCLLASKKMQTSCLQNKNLDKLECDYLECAESTHHLAHLQSLFFKDSDKRVAKLVCRTIFFPFIAQHWIQYHPTGSNKLLFTRTKILH